nr:MAG TPA: hypothetical protein [Caudoviricetes sp.]
MPVFPGCHRCCTRSTRSPMSLRWGLSFQPVTRSLRFRRSKPPG